MIDPQTSDPAASNRRERGQERERETHGVAERRGNLAIAIAAIVALVYMGSAFYLMASKPSDPLSQSLLSNGKVAARVIITARRPLCMFSVIWNDSGKKRRFGKVTSLFGESSIPAAQIL